MTRSERFFRIVQILRRARLPVSAKVIAEELEVSQRTVYRDVTALVAQGVPVSGAAGVGYVLEAGFDMPPLMLTTDELDAALLGARWVMTRGEPELARAAEDLIAKLQAMLPKQMTAQITAPSASVSPVPPIDDAVDAAELRRAVRRGLKVELEYLADPGRRTRRCVWPVLLGYRDTSRILAAWCELRGAFRYFRTDRMATVRVLDTPFPEPPALLRARWRDAMDEERASYDEATE